MASTKNHKLATTKASQTNNMTPSKSTRLAAIAQVNRNIRKRERRRESQASTKKTLSITKATKPTTKTTALKKNPKDKFLLFKNLPMELQLKIWKLAIENASGRYVLLHKKVEPVPAILHVNHISRLEALKSFTKIPRTPWHTHGIRMKRKFEYINLSKDIICFFDPMDRLKHWYSTFYLQEMGKFRVKNFFVDSGVFYSDMDRIVNPDVYTNGDVVGEELGMVYEGLEKVTVVHFPEGKEKYWGRWLGREFYKMWFESVVASAREVGMGEKIKIVDVTVRPESWKEDLLGVQRMRRVKIGRAKEEEEESWMREETWKEMLF